MIRQIIFDMGNVLMTYDPEIPLERFAHSAEERDLIRRELFGGPEWVERDCGNITREEMFRSVAKRIPAAYHKALGQCVYHWSICMKPVEATAGFLREVKRRGYETYVLSNAAEEFHTYFDPVFEPGTFAGIVLSCEEHVVKPDPKIYQTLLERFGLRAEECLFLDDCVGNVLGAREAGLEAEVFDLPHAEEFLETLLLRLPGPTRES